MIALSSYKVWRRALVCILIYMRRMQRIKRREISQRSFVCFSTCEINAAASAAPILYLYLASNNIYEPHGPKVTSALGKCFWSLPDPTWEIWIIWVASSFSRCILYAALKKFLFCIDWFNYNFKLEILKMTHFFLMGVNTSLMPEAKCAGYFCFCISS